MITTLLPAREKIIKIVFFLHVVEIIVQDYFGLYKKNIYNPIHESVMDEQTSFIQTYPETNPSLFSFLLSANV